MLSGQLMPPGYANLYIWGVGQPRGGAGPLLTAGSRLMARIVRLQRRLDQPVGDELAKLRRPEARELFGVSEMMRLIKTGDLGLWLIERGITRMLPRLRNRLVIAGGRDRLTPPVHSRRLAGALPKLAEFVEVPEAGHMTPIEAHRQVSDACVRCHTARGLAPWASG